MKILLFIFALCPILAISGTLDSVKIEITKKNLVVVPQSITVNPDSVITKNVLKKGSDTQKDEYEITVLDPEYDIFLSTQPAKEYYSMSYLKIKNAAMVSEWNMRHNSPLRYKSDIYASYIDYDPRTDYGLEFEYRLYMFFKYMEQSAHISLGAGRLQ